MAPLNAASGINRAKPFVIIPPGAYGPKAQMVTPPVVVRVEAEALVARQSLEDSAVAVAHYTAEASSPGSQKVSCLRLENFSSLLSLSLSWPPSLFPPCCRCVCLREGDIRN